MERNLLLAVGTHPHVTSGLEFVSDFITKKDDVRLTLLNIFTAYDEEGVAPLAVNIPKGKALTILEEARKTLEAAGFNHNKIALRNIRTKGTRTLSLMHEASEGQFDAVVLSHRTRMGLDDLLDTSVCTEVLKGSKISQLPPFWLCRQLTQKKTGVLLCTDGSDPSLRIADHVGTMLHEIPEHDVQVLHIADPTKEDLPDAKSIVQQTVDKLTAAGLDQSRISSKILERVGAAGVILEEATQGNFAIVAMGTTGTGQKTFSKLLTGSVARKVFNELTGAVLWASF